MTHPQPDAMDPAYGMDIEGPQTSYSSDLSDPLSDEEITRILEELERSSNYSWEPESRTGSGFQRDNNLTDLSYVEELRRMQEESEFERTLNSLNQTMNQMQEEIRRSLWEPDSRTGSGSQEEDPSPENTVSWENYYDNIIIPDSIPDIPGI